MSPPGITAAQEGGGGEDGIAPDTGRALGAIPQADGGVPPRSLHIARNSALRRPLTHRRGRPERPRGVWGGRPAAAAATTAAPTAAAAAANRSDDHAEHRVLILLRRRRRRQCRSRRRRRPPRRPRLQARQGQLHGRRRRRRVHVVETHTPHSRRRPTRRARGWPVGTRALAARRWGRRRQSRIRAIVVGDGGAPVSACDLHQRWPVSGGAVAAAAATRRGRWHPFGPERVRRGEGRARVMVRM